MKSERTKKLLGHIFNRIVVFLISLFILSLFVFFMSRMTPTDPLQSYYGERVEKMSVEEKMIARHNLGLDQPIYVQYIDWLKEALQGNWGISYKYKQNVLDVICERIGNTVVLGGLSFVLIFAGALWLGILCAYYEDTWFDQLFCKMGTLTSCIPEFWLSLILIFLFSVTLKWLPSSGAYTIGKEHDMIDRIRHMCMPLIVICMGHVWYYAFLIRNKLLEEVRADYVRTAIAKGLTKKRVMFHHCVKNVLPFYISVMAISVPHILGGTYVVEAVFAYPGLGTLSYESARYADYNLLMILCMLTGFIVLLSNLVGQIINETLDPRMKLNGNGVNE